MRPNPIHAHPELAAEMERELDGPGW